VVGTCIVQLFRQQYPRVIDVLAPQLSSTRERANRVLNNFANKLLPPPPLPPPTPPLCKKRLRKR
jgi:hypothetical protein